MIHSRKIAHRDLSAGMQFKAEGVWWQLVRVMVGGHTNRTMTLMARRVRSDGYVTAGAPRLVWLPVSSAGVEVRPGSPAETSILDGRTTRRVLLRPRHARDPRPYLDGNGGRWSRDDTAQHRKIAGLAEAFESGLTA